MRREIQAEGSGRLRRMTSPGREIHLMQLQSLRFHGKPLGGGYRRFLDTQGEGRGTRRIKKLQAEPHGAEREEFWAAKAKMFFETISNSLDLEMTLTNE
jgi:hypothetical protein